MTFYYFSILGIIGHGYDLQDHTQAKTYSLNTYVKLFKSR